MPGRGRAKEKSGGSRVCWEESATSSRRFFGFFILVDFTSPYQWWSVWESRVPVDGAPLEGILVKRIS